MRIVVDTNVLISGMFWGEGPPQQIIQAWLCGKVTVVASREILDEYRGVTARLSARKKLDVSKLLERLLMLVHFILPADLPAPVCSDSSDDKFIAAAFSGRAKYLVTGDKALLKVKRFRQTVITTPTSFCRIAKLS
ncbi:MAG: putative toxin-antitoxin system toxin component, PIN family [Deltaproteobacteria bacterium]|nr:putative toxin-antitoxin system toxin component, PIN family [Deltaproteobacteria bacterium]